MVTWSLWQGALLGRLCLGPDSEKTKGMATGDNLNEEDIALVQVKGGEIEMVDHFMYPGSTLLRDGDVVEDVKCHIAKASRAFGCLRGSIFNNLILSLTTKRTVYRAIVLSVLLYVAKTWTLKAEHVRCLQTFHNHCVRTILGISKYHQWQLRLSSKSLANRFGMDWSIPHFIMDRRLSHVGRKKDERMPKQLLFGELWKKRACHNKEEIARPDGRRPASHRFEQ